MNTKTILIASDDHEDLSTLKQQLEDEGYRVVIAGNGKEAQKAAHRLMPDLIILDVYLPEMSGGLVRLNLKEEPATSDIPVIFLSTLFSEEEIPGQDIMFGDSPRLAKPCDMRLLMRTVRRMIGQTSASVGGGES